jgi:hypothetical protein
MCNNIQVHIEIFNKYEQKSIKKKLKKPKRDSVKNNFIYFHKVEQYRFAHNQPPN